MNFVDEAKIFVKAGDGGKGCESFYTDKLNRRPRPDGGDGGHGGDIIFIADQNLRTLLDYKFRQHHKGKKGGHASSKGKTGRNAEPCLLKVPCGTIIRDFETGLLIKDLVADGQQVIAVKGGRGGIGNARNKTPKPPNLGESKVIHLELKVLADVGLIGFPNAGKSTIISNVSKARSKIASYPFTTKQPVLGIVQGEESDFLIADLPGLIEGAHKGKGLGDRFLKHAERTRILVHVIDISGSEGRDPLLDYQKLTDELRQYSDRFLIKNIFIVANKMDLEGAEENLKRFRKKYKEKIFPVCARHNKGLGKLIEALKDELC